MLNLGEQLYELTRRDLVTLKIDPFFRTTGVTLGVGQIAGFCVFNVPVDRCLYIDSLSFIGSAALNSTWFDFQVAANTLSSESRVYQQSGDLTAGLSGPITGGGLSRPVTIRESLKLIIPPGAINLTFIASRSGTTTPVNMQVYLNAYLIPPGNIGRLG